MALLSKVEKSKATYFSISAFLSFCLPELAEIHSPNRGTFYSVLPRPPRPVGSPVHEAVHADRLPAFGVRGRIGEDLE